MGNHLVSDSAATINAGTGDDESILAHGLTGSRRRRIGEDDDEADMYDDDDMESMASMPVGGTHGKPALRAEEE
jgi:regulator of nonsense transcripts 1